MVAKKTGAAQISPLMSQFSGYIASAIQKPLPPEVAERAKVHVVDTFAAMISGLRLLPGKKVCAYVKARGGRPEAGVVGTDIVVSAPGAALANGMLAHADETDDTHPASRSHPGSCIVPAAIAIGELKKLSGAAVLRAIVLGYDICARMLFALNVTELRQAGHHPLSFGGVFAAASSAGALLKLSAREIRFMLSYCAQQAAGLYCLHRDIEHIEKAFGGAGIAAQNGTAAALMVAHGFTGVEDVFAGDRNFFATFAPNARLAKLTQGLGRDYEILRAAIKRWPAGGPIQGPLQVLHEMMKLHAFRADDVDRLVARMPDRELDSVNNRDMPDICVQHLLAVMLLDGTLTHESAHDFSRMRHPQVRALRKRIDAVGDPTLTDASRRWRCVMDVTLKSGRKLRHQTMAAKGSYENPMSRRDEEDKAFDLIARVIGKQRTRVLLDALWDFEHIKDVRSLRRLMSRG